MCHILYSVYPGQRVQCSQFDGQELGQGMMFPAEGRYCCVPSDLEPWSQDCDPEMHKPPLMWTYGWSMHHFSSRCIHFTKEHISVLLRLATWTGFLAVLPSCDSTTYLSTLGRTPWFNIHVLGMSTTTLRSSISVLLSLSGQYSSAGTIISTLL